MEILIRGDYQIFVIGNLITDISIALFAFVIWYIQKTTSKITLLLNIYRSRGFIDDIQSNSILVAFEMVDYTLLEQTYTSFTFHQKEEFKKKADKLFHKKKILSNFQIIILLLFLIGLSFQMSSLLIPVINTN